MENSPTTPDQGPPLTARETPSERKRRKRSRMVQIMNRESMLRKVERESKMAMLMSLARRAVRRAMTYDGRTIVGRWRRDRMLRKWQQDSADLANISRPWTNP
jgi:hypothetical protein